MEPLEQDENVRAVTALMDVNGRREMSVDLFAVLMYVSEMERQNQTLERELHAMKAELEELKARKSPLAKAMEAAVNAAQKCADDVKEQLSGVREAVISWAKDTVENTKLRGVSALDESVTALHIRHMLQNAQSGIQGALESVRAAVDRGEEMGFQLREAGRALGNAVKTAQGKAENRTPAVREGKFQKTVLAPSRTVKNVLNSMNETALNGVNALEKLERAGRVSRDRLAEKKPSVRQELERNKTRTAAFSAPERSRKTPEAAL